MFTSCPHGSCARKLLKLAAYGRGNVKRFRLSSERMTKKSFHLDLPELYPQVFSFSPAIADGTLLGYKMCDWIDNAIAMQMGHSDGQIYGYLHVPCRVELNARLTGADQERKLG